MRPNQLFLHQALKWICSLNKITQELHLELSRCQVCKAWIKIKLFQYSFGFIRPFSKWRFPVSLGMWRPKSPHSKDESSLFEVKHLVGSRGQMWTILQSFVLSIWKKFCDLTGDLSLSIPHHSCNPKIWKKICDLTGELSLSIPNHSCNTKVNPHKSTNSNSKSKQK